MSEQVIIIKNTSGEIVSVIAPHDALNPGLTVYVIEANPDLEAELHTVNDLESFLAYLT